MEVAHREGNDSSGGGTDGGNATPKRRQPERAQERSADEAAEWGERKKKVRTPSPVAREWSAKGKGAKDREQNRQQKRIKGRLNSPKVPGWGRNFGRQGQAMARQQTGGEQRCRL